MTSDTPQPAEPAKPTHASKEPKTVLAMAAPPPMRPNPLTRSVSGVIGSVFLIIMIGACVLSLPYTLGTAPDPSAGAGSDAEIPRYNAGTPAAGGLPPSWVPADEQQIVSLNALVDQETVAQIAADLDMPADQVLLAVDGPAADRLREHWPTSALGTDKLGRSLFIRVLTGGGISLGIGIAAAVISVFIGTMYGVIAGYAGGRVDAIMMRLVDILYGLPYILLVVLLAVAGDAVLDEYISRGGDKQAYVLNEARPLAEQANAAPADFLADNPEINQELRAEAQKLFPARQISDGRRLFYDVLILLVAISAVSWLTMARVIRGQVLSLKAQPYMEAARAIGVPLRGQFLRHLLPNLLGPIIVYATLTVPQAILQESFLSFLGIGVRPPLPSWGNLAAEGLSELNTHRSDWWQLLFPCLLLGLTLLALNFVGEGLRVAIDPKRGQK